MRRICFCLGDFCSVSAPYSVTSMLGIRLVRDRSLYDRLFWGIICCWASMPERSTHQRRLSTVSLSSLGPFPAAAAPRRSTRKQDYHVIRFRMGEGKQQQLKARLLQALSSSAWMDGATWGVGPLLCGAMQGMRAATKSQRHRNLPSRNVTRSFLKAGKELRITLRDYAPA